MPPPQPTRKSALARAFGAAADAYHGDADVQREVAARLARRIAAAGLASRPRILEVGCGTGFLHQALAPALPGGDWLLTDLSEPMVRRARRTVGPGARYAVMDGERPAARAGGFDLVCASLAVQWFDDLGAALAGLAALLAPGGVLAFATLAAGSFPEWRRAHRDLGVRAAVRAYPAPDALRAMAPPGTRLDLSTESIARAYPDARAFLAHWKRIGTHLPASGRAPLAPGVMRKLLARFADGITVTYDVAYGIARTS